ncbi:MAG: hypothetical protein HWE24_19915 [Oceanospirillaceae bacterium]|nr:hypothetical protein [Oceanospirillaceae bacterium]
MLDPNKYSPTQLEILNKLYPELGALNPREILYNACELYYSNISEIVNLRTEFIEVIENNLSLCVSRVFDFYEFEKFREEFDSVVELFLDENPDSTVEDFYKEQIKIQESMIESSYELIIELNNGDSINIFKIIGKDFLNQFKYRSEKKLKFLYSIINSDDDKLIPNPYDKIFINGAVYNSFMEYADKFILEGHRDWSYLKKRLYAEELIYNIKDQDFIKFLRDDVKLISSKTHDKFTKYKSLLALDKSSSINRENNFNVVFSRHIRNS